MAAPVKNGFSCTTIRNLKAATKQQKVSDEKGLYLLVTPTGGKLWRMNYRFDGKQKTLSLGSYPDVSLKEARNRRDEARKVIANGEDPGAIKQAQKAATKVARKNTFEAAARDWYEEWSKGVTPGTAEHTWSILRRRVFPALGSVPVAQIKLKAILDVLREFEAAGVSNAVKKAKVAISQIMAKAVEDEKAERNPVKDMRRGAFDFRVKKHHAAITTPVEVGALLRAIDRYTGQPEVFADLKLAPLLFARIGELRTKRWSYVDLDRAEWRYTVSKTKTDHLVPLARQAVAILRSLHLLTGRGEWVFPGLISGKPISDATINRALQRMGYDTKTEMTGHGFRAMARTLLAEELHYPPEVIEHQLAHNVPDALGEAYNRTRFLTERREMMQAWADYLDSLKAGAKVFQFQVAG